MIKIIPTLIETVRQKREEEHLAAVNQLFDQSQQGKFLMKDDIVYYQDETGRMVSTRTPSAAFLVAAKYSSYSNVLDGLSSRAATVVDVENLFIRILEEDERLKGKFRIIAGDLHLVQNEEAQLVLTGDEIFYFVENGFTEDRIRDFIVYSIEEEE